MTVFITIAAIIATSWWKGPFTTSRIVEIKGQTWAYNYIKYEQLGNLIYSAHLPWDIFGVGVTIELLEEKLSERCVLLGKEYEVLMFVSI